MKTKPNVGDRVRWTSQSNAVTTTKEGVVIYSGEPSYTSRRYNPRLPEEVRTARNSHVMFDSMSSGVIVRVCAGQYTDESGIYLYYAPRLSNLEVIS